MRRGFKTWAAKESLRLRTELGVGPDDPLPARILADHLGVTIRCQVSFDQFEQTLSDKLQEADRTEWSAFTFSVGENHIIFHNSLHSPARQESNLMHEIAHILCKHPPPPVLLLGSLHLRPIDPEAEAEAEWLGGVLQIPRDALLNLRRRGLDKEYIANHFGAAAAMVTKRINTEGIERQLQRSRTIYRR